MRKLILLVLSHGAMLAVGFALGIYFLPILTAPPGPSSAELANLADSASYTAEFKRDLAGSDRLHWGEGELILRPDAIALMGKLAPGPDYKLYLTPEFVQTRAGFEAIKAESLRVGDVKTFENFVVPLTSAVDLSQYKGVVVWCEAFSQFITAAQYR